MKAIALILFACYVSSQYVPPPKPFPREKPGTCPVSDIITTCECRPELITCNGDYECPGSQKCCSYGCGCRTSCVDPIGLPGIQKGCRYNGRRYRIGESFPSSDGCNTCTCGVGGQVSCTEKACLQLGCMYNGKRYREGESFPSIDGCNTCSCGAKGRVVCTKRACIKPIKDVCSQPKVVGPCRAAFRRFWYNRRTNQCERFIYGGCRGNENNFETLQECQTRCQRNTYRPSITA
uniref:Four-domain proteases inhibitor-like isoform X1 n=2 Tax=Crassostrea virginica TaxID=6565 RepID=A0A8B8C819_CRAVI|nr:four-domain proteases inhibitor-like isoform X1 [Crassostrea virginica]